jgi:hypothetical protein
VRAFRKKRYKKARGYDAARTVLDGQNLMCRLFPVGNFHRIPRCLYLQRKHSANTQHGPEINAHIQREMVALYDKYIGANALNGPCGRGLLAVDLSAAYPARPRGRGPVPGRGRRHRRDPAREAGPARRSVDLMRAVDFLRGREPHRDERERRTVRTAAAGLAPRGLMTARRLFPAGRLGWFGPCRVGRCPAERFGNTGGRHRASVAVRKSRRIP